jgi:hypothetical protein
VQPVDDPCQRHPGEGDEPEDRAAVAPTPLGLEGDDVDPDVDHELKEELDEHLHKGGGNFFHGGLR